MNRNLRALGLAMAAVFAIGAAAASAASAQQGVLTSEGPVTLTAVETGVSGSNAWTMFGLAFSCPESTYTGHKYNVTPHTFIPSGATTVTMTPVYKQVSTSTGKANCRMSFGNFPATVDMNGCDYVAHLGETNGGADTYSLTFDIVCPAGKEIVWTVFTTDTKHAENKLFCTMSIPPQTGLAGADATGTTNGYIDITGALEGIYVVKKNGGEDPLLCPAAETLSGKLDIDLTVSGHNEGGGETILGLTHN